MRAIGIDVGGTKIEAQVFDDGWRVVDRKRIETPRDYDGLVRAMADQIGWADAQAGAALPVGVAAAGLLNPRTGHAFTANLPASGKPFPTDIATAARPVTYVNDCRAMALSEAVFGAGRGFSTVMALILGTGVGGGIAVGGELLSGPTQTGGEFGHASASAALVTEHELPIVTCGCGRRGCIETLIAGPGMTRIAQAVTGIAIAPPDIAAQRSGTQKDTWRIWLALVADHLRNLTLTVDPDVILLGGGLSQIDGLVPELEAAFQDAQIGDFAIPRLALAQGGDASGARGAAYAAWQEAADEA